MSAKNKEKIKAKEKKEVVLTENHEKVAENRRCDNDEWRYRNQLIP